MYKIAIRNNATKEIRNCKLTGKWDDNREFYWTEGNGSCDCNREIRFRMAENETVDESIKCGDSAFSILYVMRCGKVICEFDEN